MRSPDEVRRLVRRTEWEHVDHFRDQWLGDRQGVRVGLNPGNRVGEDPVALRSFREAWEKVREDLQAIEPDAVRFEGRTLRLFGLQQLPVELHLTSLDGIARFLGNDAVERLRDVRRRLGPFMNYGDELARAAKRVVLRLEMLSEAEASMLAAAVPQLKRGMGAGLFLRSLPLDKVDTKFLERNASTVYLLLNAYTRGDVQSAGGLEEWLGCVTKGADRILIRPLCAETRAGFCGAVKLWVTSDDLANMRLLGRFVLIIENEVAALALPDIAETTCIAGAGQNLAWLRDIDLSDRVVGYWGDIDTWGLRCLAQARDAFPALVALLMDQATLDAHPAQVVREPTSTSLPVSGLSQAERALFERLTSDASGPTRLEQEKLAATWVHTALQQWVRAHEMRDEAVSEREPRTSEG